MRCCSPQRLLREPGRAVLGDCLCPGSKTLAAACTHTSTASPLYARPSRPAPAKSSGAVKAGVPTTVLGLESSAELCRWQLVRGGSGLKWWGCARVAHVAHSRHSRLGLFQHAAFFPAKRARLLSRAGGAERHPEWLPQSLALGSQPPGPAHLAGAKVAELDLGVPGVQRLQAGQSLVRHRLVQEQILQLGQRVGSRQHVAGGGA